MKIIKILHTHVCDGVTARVKLGIREEHKNGKKRRNKKLHYFSFKIKRWVYMRAKLFGEEAKKKFGENMGKQREREFLCKLKFIAVFVIV